MHAFGPQELKDISLDSIPHREIARLTDCALMEGVQQGDEQALASLYDGHSNLVYSVALRILGDAARAEDVLQDVFMQIWRSPKRFIVAQGNFPQWVALVSRNQSIDMLRKPRTLDPPKSSTLNSPNELTNHAQQNVMCDEARALIGELQPEQRKVLDMVFFEGLSYSEIAVMMGSPLHMIKSNIRNALLTLKKSRQAEAGRAEANYARSN